MISTSRFTSRHSVRTAASRAATILIEPVERRTLMSAGALDPAFGTGGVITGYIGTVAVDATGRTLVSGLTSDKSGTYGTLTRLLRSGSIDTTFGTNGTAAIHGIPTQVLVEPNGKILLVDSGYPMPGGALQQLTAAGQPDATFGTAGVAPAANPATGAYIVSAALGPNDTIYATDSENLKLDRYTAAGKLDATFGTNGEVSLAAALPASLKLSINDTYGNNIGVAADAAGRPVVEVSLFGNWIDQSVKVGMVRYTTTGAPDASFGSTGLAVGPSLQSLTDGGLDGFRPNPVVAPDGTIYAATNINVVATNQNNPLLYAFASNGKSVSGGRVPTGSAGSTVEGLAVDAAGRPIADFTSSTASYVARFKPVPAGGTPTYDGTFAGSGAAQLPVTVSDFFSDRFVLGPTGDITLSGIGGLVRVLTAGTSSVTPVAAAGKVIGSAGSYANRGDTIAKAFDGNPNTFYDAYAYTGDWAGLDLGTAAKPVVQVQFAPRAGFAGRMVGGRFQVSSTPDFSSDVQTIYTVTTAPTVGTLTTAAVGNVAAYRFARYLGPAGGECNVAEVRFLVAGPTQLTGTVIGTSGSYANQGNTIANAFDGNPNTFVDAAAAGGSYVGLDLGSAKVVTLVRFAPRAGFAGRMVGGRIQASNTADFGAGVVTAYTITAAPPVGTLTTVSPSSTPAAYRYWRYVGPSGSFGNIAELEFDG